MMITDIEDKHRLCTLLNVRALPKEPASQVDYPDVSKCQCERERQHARQRHEVNHQCALPETTHLSNNILQ